MFFNLKIPKAFPLRKMSITDSFCSSEPSFSEEESLTSYFSEFESSSDENDASENSFANYDSNDDEDFGHWENYEEGTR